MSFLPTSLRARLAEERGFTLLATVGVMFVTAMLLTAAFIVATGDSHLSARDTASKQAYYAAIAGIQQYEYELQANPDYWQTCKTPSGSLPEESHTTYEIKLLPAKGQTECSTASPFTSMIETGGSAANTFRIKSTGTVNAGTATQASRSVVSTFEVAGFLDYIYFTNYEQGDPKIFESGSEVEHCEKKYYTQWSEKKYNCTSIEFTTGDSVNGPMHTNDSADVGGSATFGREGHSPADVVEINGGTYPTAGCKGSAKYYTASGCYTKGVTLQPPENDTSLGFYVEAENTFEGVTYLELKGSEGTEGKIAVTTYNNKGEEQKKTINWPKNGLIYVKENPSVSCNYEFSIATADEETERKNEKGCGTVYVKGTYQKSLTVAGERELVINGEIYPTNVASTLGSAPSGTATLGLIASKYVRVFHECSGSNGTSLKDPWIYAAILSTEHSFIVDHYDCGANLGKLHIYGAIAQNYRGAVGTGGGFGGGTGYLKDYKSDERLATEEPPYFLAPLKAGWKIGRLTAPTAG